MFKSGKCNRGIALIFVLLAVIVVVSALSIVGISVQSSMKETNTAYNMVVAEEAAQAGIDMTIKRLWNDYITTNGNTTGNWASFKYYLNNTLHMPINEDLNFNGVKDANETGNGDATFDKYPTGYDRRGMSFLAAAQPFKDSKSQRVVATLNNVFVGRYDEVTRSDLTITSVASAGGVTKTAVQVLTIGGADLPHTQFAILANNISCILCHAEFLSLGQQRNTDKTKYGTFDRIKVASLQSMMVRPTEAISDVAGTFYTRGKVYDNSGNLLTASSLAASTLKAYGFNSTNGKINQNTSTGALTQVSLANGTSNANGDLNQFANLYMNYPTDATKQTDGALPGTFPAPFPDDNNNRTVDDSEFQVIVNTANGKISGGVAYGVPSGSVYSGTALPTASNTALSSLQTGSYNGNLILVGTAASPIVISDDVAVNGDLVIAGPVQGTGQLLVRGNTYVVGDVTYQDAPGQFGQDVNGNQNLFALVTGGSVMMGDYLTVRGVNHSALANDQFPDYTQYSISARDKNLSNSVTLKVNGVNKTETLPWGYFDTYSVDAGQTTSGREGQQYSFTTSEMMLFNKQEMDKAVADSTYTPRFYGLRESQPNDIYIWNSTEEHAVRYDYPGVTLLSSYLTAKGLPLSIKTKAVYQYCNPKSNWMSESTLRNIWYADEMTRPSSGRAFLFDGLIYSNNSVWNIVRSKTRHKSNTNGSMTIRGGVIAADLGMFVPGNGSTVGLNMLYDPRVERFLNVRDTSTVQFKRAAFYFSQS
jgi:hypothetical protein